MTGIDSRRDLMYALSEAAEIEHALLCQYLFAGYSIRRFPADDIPPDRLRSLQNWAGTILLVAREEMEHLGTVCNLLASIGAAPDFRRPNFPQPARYFGEIPSFSLERFSLDTIRRFAEFEKPEYLHLREGIARKIEDRRSGIEDDLAVVLETVGTDGLWDYGEAWISDGEVLRLATIWAKDPGSAGADALRRKAIQWSDAGVISQSADILGEAFTSGRWVSAVFESTAPPGIPEGALGTEHNTAAAIPVLVDGRVLAVTHFRYNTYLDRSEDDAFVNIVFNALNGEDETGHAPNRLNRLLRRHLRAERLAPLTDLRLTQEVLMPRRLDFTTIGGFYRHIRKGLLALGTDTTRSLFIGPPDSQITAKEIGLPFPGWHNVNPGRVTDLSSAVAAIDQIIVEGEGAPDHSESSHYGRFRAIAEELSSVLDVDPDFSPSVPAASNPVVRIHNDMRPEVFLFPAAPAEASGLDRGIVSTTLIGEFRRRANITVAADARVEAEETGVAWTITDPKSRHLFVVRRAADSVAVFQAVTVLEPDDTAAVADLFNATYEMMLLMLIRLYAHTDDSDDDLHELAGVAFLPLMTQVLRPLAEVLMTMPATTRHPELRAGPTFEVYRDLQTLPHRDSAWTIFQERLRDISDECGRLAGTSGPSKRLHLLHRNLARIAGRLEARTSPKASA